MTEQQTEMTIIETEDSSNALVTSLRRILMASIGAIVLAQEEIEEFLGRLVDRGEIADADARRLLNDLRDGRIGAMQEGVQNTLQGTIRVPDADLDKRVGSVLSRLNIPTKVEIDALNDRIAELSNKVDELISLRQK